MSETVARTGDPINLGIIGGCLSHQHGIAHGELYHQRLAALVAASSGRRLRVHIARSFELGYEERLERLLARTALDVVMLHLRSTILTRSSLVVRSWTGGGMRSQLNPALLRRHHRFAYRSGNDELRVMISDAAELAALDRSSPDAYNGSRPPQDAEPPGRAIAGFRLRNINHLMGKWTGLHGWAIDDELLRLDGFLRACERRGVPVLLLGPTPATYGPGQADLIRRYGAAIRRHVAGTSVPLALVETPVGPSGLAITRPDGIHITAEGHEMVGQALFQAGTPYWSAAAGPQGG